jgi:hypothetical protein
MAHLTPITLRAYSARADNPTNSKDEGDYIADVQAFELETVIASENFEQQPRYFIPRIFRQKKYQGCNLFLQRLGIGSGDLAKQLEAAGYLRLGNEGGAPIRQLYSRFGFES